MESLGEKLRISWYRCPLSREQLRDLNKRSNFEGFVQVLGFLATMALTTAAVLYAIGRWPWYVVILLLVVHGTVWCCSAFGFHELVHDSVFKTRWLNSFFCRIIAFFNWQNPYFFWYSHMEHHKYTLHPPEDLEVVLPIHVKFWSMLRRCFWYPEECKWFVDQADRHAHGRIEGQWENTIFPASNVEARRKVFNWARFMIAGHGLILAVSIYMHWWMVPVLVTFPRCYASGLFHLFNDPQHMGLQDNVNDFRLCCRTITLNPVLEFLYWHMNYHTEHHMYAAVPCYNLAKLHTIIKDDMPTCPHGLISTWKHLATILAHQKEDPNYKYIPDLPVPNVRRSGAPQAWADGVAPRPA